MKTFFKVIITKILILRVKHLLKKSHTQIIAITGSIGKTSTKAAVNHILKNRFKILTSNQGFNTELGICLTILSETESGFSSPIQWLKILKRSLFDKKVLPKKIVLEMGSDKPGDIKKLVKIAPPKFGIITQVAKVHLANGQFADIDEIAKEKNELIRQMSSEDIAILNADDERVRKMKTQGKKFTFGASHASDLQVGEVKMTATNIQFFVTYKNESVQFTVPILGKFLVYVCLPAIAVGLNLDMNLKECADALRDFTLPVGRMNPIKGINNSRIIDGSYNASPITTQNGLSLLKNIPGGRKIAALGTMNELGDLSKQAHLDIGQKTASSANLLIAVGPEAGALKKGAIEAGMPESHVFTFFNSEDAGNYLKNHIEPKDVILVKGSQNKIRMEKLVKIIMADPSQAKVLLCRQSETWEKI